MKLIECMSSYDICSVTPAHYNEEEQKAFKFGIQWYEKYVARVGVYSENDNEYEAENG